MTQDRPLTRRELRERERLLERQATSSTPETEGSAPAFPVSPPPAAPAFPPAPAAAPAAAAPVPAPAASAPAAAAAAPAVPAPADESPFAPRATTPQAWSRPEPVDDDEPMPERTLTRRELRALIESTQLDDYDDDLDDDGPRVPAPAGERTSEAPSRVTAPHDDANTDATEASVVPAKPHGHWTSQLDLPEEQPEPFDQLLARGGGGSHGVPTTTNALILPSLPSQAALGQPLPDGGEIMVTGSIDLPRSFGSTGMHPSQLDSSDVDRLLDHVEDAAGAAAAPVAASRAISTQGHPRDMIAPPKKEGVNAPLVLAVTAGVLALGVVASLVVGAMVGIF